MGALRLILLGAGLLFLALLAWLGSRRPRRVQSEDVRAPQARGEPSIGGEAPDAIDTLGPITSSAAMVVQGAGQALGDDPMHATLIDLPVISSTPDPQRSPPRGSPSEPVTPVPPEDAAALTGAIPELRVAWPPENERYIVTLRVVGVRGTRIQGRLLRQGLAATGFRHGPFGIYHVGHADGRVLISAASLVRPGLLDPDNMDFQHYPGVNLFAVLPAPLAPADLLERFCTAAFDLAGRIEGSVQDEGGAPLAPPDSADWRARCIAGFAQRAGAH